MAERSITWFGQNVGKRKPIRLQPACRKVLQKPRVPWGHARKVRGGIGRKAGHISPVLALCPMFLAMSGTVPAFASGGSPAGSVIDTGLVGELVNLVKQVAELFTIFPINVFLIGSLAGLGFALFRKAKHTAVD